MCYRGCDHDFVAGFLRQWYMVLSSGTWRARFHDSYVRLCDHTLVSGLRLVSCTRDGNADHILLKGPIHHHHLTHALSCLSYR
jgi:hypothetical protein